jgi:hypothetical protein
MSMKVSTKKEYERKLKEVLRSMILEACKEEHEWAAESMSSTVCDMIEGLSLCRSMREAGIKRIYEMRTYISDGYITSNLVSATETEVDPPSTSLFNLAICGITESLAPALTYV